MRTLQPEDVTEDYLCWLSDPAINAYLEVRFSPPLSQDDLASFVAKANTSSHTLLLGIFLHENGSHIGNIKLGPIDWNHKVGDVGFIIGDNRQWGKGYASQAIAMLAEYAFKHLSLSKITAGCYADNVGSCRALLKAGFFEESRRPSQWLVNGTRQDGFQFGRISPNIEGLQTFGKNS
ncbi:MAG: GNAT family N-acetyltransferase [Chlorobium sp.]